MRTIFFCRYLLPGIIATCLVFSSTSAVANTDTTINPASAGARSNPLLQPWPGPYDGVPPYDRVQVSNFKPALETAITQMLAAVATITSNPQPPDFENTLADLMRAYDAFYKVAGIYYTWSWAMSSPAYQKVEQEMEPRLAAVQDQITLNEGLFRRIEVIYGSPQKRSLTNEQQRLVGLYYNNFVRSGAKLDSAGKAQLSSLNQQLATLYTQFTQNILADEQDSFVVLKSPADLAGLPASVIDAAAENAKAKNLDKTWVITNTRSSVEPFLTYSTRRDLREKVQNMFIRRGDNGGEHDNNSIASQVLLLRAQKAKLLGYPTYAHWKLETTMAKNPEAAMQLMEAVWQPAVTRVRQDVAAMQTLADQEKVPIKIAPWDYRYYAEKLRQKRYDYDEGEVKEYLQLEKMREAIFWVAGELFNFSFIPALNIPVYHPDVRVWEVRNKKDNQHVGYWYFDPYARNGKRSGAWMDPYRLQQRMDSNVTALTSNNTNFVKVQAGEPVLISWGDALTLFHEFGHALHYLSYNVKYPPGPDAYGGDFSEFPSQLLEHWLLTPEVLQRFALHYKTGKPIPASLIAKIQKAKTFNQGFITTEYLADAILDLKLHLAEEQKIDLAQFERDTLAAMGMPPEIVLRHRLPHFLHVFSSDGYAAGYYSYLWADVLTADAYEAFMEAGGPYNKTVAQRLKQYILSVGGSIDPAEAYRNFRGRDPSPAALMRKRGFADTSENSVAKPAQSQKKH